MKWNTTLGFKVQLCSVHKNIGKMNGDLINKYNSRYLYTAFSNFYFFNFI